MSLPQPNYTQIPNVVFDHWMPRLKPATFTVLLCLCRKIFGWHKSTDTISRNQLMKCTGMSKNTVKVALDELSEEGLIKVVSSMDERGHRPNGYTLILEKSVDQIYVDQEEISQSLRVPRSEIDQGVGQKLTKGVGQNLTTQKKDSTKERLTKEGASTPPRVHSSEKRPNTKQRAPHVFTTDEEHLRLTKTFGPEVRDSAYEFLSNWKLDTSMSKWKKDDNRSIHRWVMAALQEEKVRQKKIKDIGNEEDNISFAQRIAENFNLSVAPRHGVRIDVTSQHIEFIALTAQMPPVCIPFHAKGFKEQVDNTLRKWRLK